MFADVTSEEMTVDSMIIAETETETEIEIGIWTESDEEDEDAGVCREVALHLGDAECEDDVDGAGVE